MARAGMNCPSKLCGVAVVMIVFAATAGRGR